MDSQRNLAIALVLQFLALLLTVGSNGLITRALQHSADASDIGATLQLVLAAAVGVVLLTAIALILLARIVLRGAGRDRLSAVAAFLVGLVQLVAGSVVLWSIT